MTFNNLYKLCQYLNTTGIKNSLVEIKEETSFGMAFGLSWSNSTNTQKVKGQFIVLESVSSKESDELHLLLKSLMCVSDYLYKTWFDYYGDGKFRIIINI